MADQNRFWLAKCSNWSENGQWPTVISSIVSYISIFNTYLCLYNYLGSNELLNIWNNIQKHSVHIVNGIIEYLHVHNNKKDGAEF